jgi:cytochrome c peroxidase
MRGIPAVVAMSVATLVTADAFSPRSAFSREARTLDRIYARATPVADTASVATLALGQRLFEDATLSRDSTTSCATCHMPTHAFAEPRAVSHGVGPRARKRNAPSLLNVVAFPFPLDWDGRANTAEDQLRGVFATSGDMGIDLGEAVTRVRRDRSYDDAFRRATGRGADVDGLLAALVAFERSLVDDASRFDRFYMRGESSALSAAEKRGWQLFQRSGCAGCHVPMPEPGGSGLIVFGENRFHNLGIGYENGRTRDVGRYAVTHAPSDLGAFKTPSLRNVALTAPYMHDGSLATLDDVVAFYSRGGIKNPRLDQVMVPRNLRSEDQRDLVAFLGALSTEWVSDSTAVRRRLLRYTDLLTKAPTAAGLPSAGR